MRGGKIAILVLGLTLTLPASAAVMPRPGTGDPRIQTVEYDSAEVVTLRVALGYALTVEFAPDERIEDVAVGNSAVWQVTPNKGADHLFVKPTEGATETDMTVVTDARTYNFDLQPLGAPDPTMPFVVRILYPVAIPVPELQAQSFYYHFTGSKIIRPTEMSDDGESTSILWPPKAPIPAVYAIDAEGREALVNGALRSGRYVVDQIATEFIFRLGDQEAHATRRLVKARTP